MHQGIGGSIPFMSMLGERFPQAQFLITGVMGPGSNAHGPNESLDLPTVRDGDGVRGPGPGRSPPLRGLPVGVLAPPRDRGRLESRLRLELTGSVLAPHQPPAAARAAGTAPQRRERL